MSKYSQQQVNNCPEHCCKERKKKVWEYKNQKYPNPSLHILNLLKTGLSNMVVYINLKYWICCYYSFLVYNLHIFSFGLTLLTTSNFHQSIIQVISISIFLGLPYWSEFNLTSICISLSQMLKVTVTQYSCI